MSVNEGNWRVKMNGFVAYYLKLMEGLDVIIRKLLLVFAGLMTVTVILQVLCRYVLKNPLAWTEELARYLMVWMAFSGASCVIKKWDNIYVDILINMLKKKPKKIMFLVQKFVILGLLIYSFYLCITVFPRVSAFQNMPVMGLGMIWAQSSMIVGFLLMALQNIGVILSDLFERDTFGGEGI
jgi:TRAP-type C4-dicarboxylate transport system permease small subunit